MKEKKKLMINDCVINKVLDKTKEVIDNEKFDSTKILIDTDNRLKDDINFKNVLILMTCVDNDNCDNDKYYPQLFLEEALWNAQGLVAAFYSLNLTIKLG